MTGHNRIACNWVYCDRCPRLIRTRTSGVTSLAALASTRTRVATSDGWTSRQDNRTGKTLDLCKRCSELQAAGWQ